MQHASLLGDLHVIGKPVVFQGALPDRNASKRGSDLILVVYLGATMASTFRATELYLMGGGDCSFIFLATEKLRVYLRC